MKFTPLTNEQYAEKCLSLQQKGWLPVGSCLNKEMKFMRGGKVYDLSAADLTKLPEIEEKELFVVAEF